MWLKPSSILPLWVFLISVAKCLGVFSPAFGVVKTESPLPPPSPTPPSGKNLYNGTTFFKISIQIVYTQQSACKYAFLIDTLNLPCYRTFQRNLGCFSKFVAAIFVSLYKEAIMIKFIHIGQNKPLASAFLYHFLS